ncbi:hypothetical protein [Rahnella contaminans]|uniref:hypothetical protein n=1 Tax=Rahnella contaminans TaxID=2703882 RepID=UPI003C2D2264
MKTDAQIVTSPAPFVKPETAKKHPRIVRDPVSSQDITVQQSGHYRFAQGVGAAHREMSA